MENRYSKTKSLVEAGLLSALIVIIMLLNVYVPVFSSIGTFLLPIPVTLLFIRYNLKITLSAIIVSAVLISMLYNPLSALGSAITYGFTGISLGYCIKNKLKGTVTLFYLTISSIISILLSAAITIFLIYKTDIFSIIKQFTDMFKESMDMAVNLYSNVGVDTAQIEPMLKAWETFTPEYIMMVLPAFVIMTAFITAFINYMVTRTILKKMRYNIVELAPFERVYLDNRIGALIIIFVCLGIILTSKKVSIGDYIFSSSVVILQFAFIIDGVALAVYYLKNKFYFKKTMLILVIGFALMSRLGIIFMYLGIADMIFDFRKLDKNSIFRKRDY